MFIIRRIVALIVSAWFLFNPVSTATVSFSDGTPIIPEKRIIAMIMTDFLLVHTLSDRGE